MKVNKRSFRKQFKEPRKDQLLFLGRLCARSLELKAFFRGLVQIIRILSDCFQSTASSLPSKAADFLSMSESHVQNSSTASSLLAELPARSWQTYSTTPENLFALLSFFHTLIHFSSPRTYSSGKLVDS